MSGGYSNSPDAAAVLVSVQQRIFIFSQAFSVSFHFTSYRHIVYKMSKTASGISSEWTTLLHPGIASFAAFKCTDVQAAGLQIYYNLGKPPIWLSDLEGRDESMLAVNSPLRKKSGASESVTV